jgi:hypothetical protein
VTSRIDGRAGAWEVEPSGGLVQPETAAMATINAAILSITLGL